MSRKFTDEGAWDVLKRRGKEPVTYRSIATILGEVASTVREFVEGTLRPLDARLAALEAATAEQRASPPTLADSFRGTWMPGTTYCRGSLTVWDGSLWLSLVDNEQKPGTTAAWKMLCKKGRDGKDLR